MNGFMDIVRGRRSVRKYEPRPIPQEALDTVLEAVRWAPSWANTQCWEVVVVRDPERKRQLQETLPEKGNPARPAMVEAPVVLALCGRLRRSGYYKDQAVTKFGDWMLFDLGIACQNLCLAAHALGLGTVIVGLFAISEVFLAVEEDRVRDVVRLVAGTVQQQLDQRRRPEKATWHFFTLHGWPFPD